MLIFPKARRHRSRSHSRENRHRDRPDRRSKRVKSRSVSRSPRRHRRSRSRSPARRRSRSPLRTRSRGGGGSRVENPTPSRCIAIFGLSMYTRERELRDIFSHYGSIEDVQVVYDKQSGRSRGFGFVYYKNVDDAVKARDRMNGQDLDGRHIRVDFSTTTRGHSPTPGIYLGRCSK